jgi:hypothetical protein
MVSDIEDNTPPKLSVSEKIKILQDEATAEQWKDDKSQYRKICQEINKLQHRLMTRENAH